MPIANTNQIIDEEKILKRYESLPDDLKEALMGVNTADAIYEIGRKANLNVEKIGALAEEVGLIILGFVPSANFISDLKAALEIDEEKASEIANEINQRVFLPIRESLKRLHGAEWEKNLVKPPVKFESQKITEVKPGAPLPEIKPSRAAAPLPKEPLIIKPLGVSRPSLPPIKPTETAKPIAPLAPQGVPQEKKPPEISMRAEPSAEEKKPPIVVPPKSPLPSAPKISPLITEAGPQEVKPPPSLPVDESESRSAPHIPAPKPTTLPKTPETPKAKPGFDPYREPIE